MEEIIVEQRTYYPGLFVARLINVIVGIIEVILGLRIILELLGANAASEFVNWIYSIGASLIGPFANAFAPVSLGNGAVVDINAILAMIAYAIIGWLLIELLSLIFVSSIP